MPVSPRTVTVGALVALGALLSPAQAADFYVLDLHDGSASLVQPAEIGDLGGGHKVAVIYRVSEFSLLHIDKIEYDCNSPQQMLISEIMHDLTGSLAPTDKTALAGTEWKPLTDGTVAMHFRTFVCEWPNVRELPEKMEDADIWALSKRVVPILQDMQMEAGN